MFYSKCLFIEIKGEPEVIPDPIIDSLTAMENPVESGNELKVGEHNIGNSQHKHCDTTFKSTKFEF